MFSPSSLCAACRQMTILESPCGRNHHDHLKDFIEAVKGECFICSQVWQGAGARLQDLWQELSESDKRFRIIYTLSKDASEGDDLKARLMYLDQSCRPEITKTARFHLMPTEDARNKLFFSVPNVEPETCSSASFKLISGWLQRCLGEHPRCRQFQNTSNGWRPTRLIDIGLGDSPEWKLCIMAQEKHAPSSPYMTLSYRWGPSPGLRLLTSTMLQFRRGQPIANLPKTFQDLVLTARHFSVRYLWIDALCIIQDSAEDWEREALNMRLVYANSLCNIAAAASTDEHGGLFRTREPKSVQHGIVHMPGLHPIYRDYYVVDRDYFDKSIFSSELHHRGWVFQERHLAPRALHFGRNQILWECFEDLRCEGFPHGVPFSYAPRGLDNLRRLTSDENQFSLRVRPDSRMPDTVFSCWNNLVKGYSNCGFTKTSDKLLAFSGIAKVFQEVTGDDYVAGIWKSRFLDGLDWRVSQPKHLSSPDYRAPSWSWASVDSPLRYGRSTSASVFLVTLIDVSVEPSGTDPTGPILSARLSLQGCLVEAVCKNLVSDGLYAFEINNHEVLVNALFDTLDNTIYVGQMVYCLPLRIPAIQTVSGFSIEVVFLLLQVVGGTSAFRRIGHFLLDEESGLQEFGLPFEHGIGGPLRKDTLSIITIL